MKRCKLDNCRNEAVDGPWRKRYCRPCGENYLRKRKEYNERQLTLPMCEAGCGQRARGSMLHPDGPLVPFEHGLCQSCQTAAENSDAEDAKQIEWNGIDSVEELKRWMREYLL